MRPEIELNLIKEEVLTSKEEILAKIMYLLEETYLCEEEVSGLNKLKSKLEKTDIPSIESDINEEKINSYCIMVEEGMLYKGKLMDFYFEYDNKEHKLFLSSYTSETEDEPII